MFAPLGISGTSCFKRDLMQQFGAPVSVKLNVNLKYLKLDEKKKIRENNSERANQAI